MLTAAEAATRLHVVDFRKPDVFDPTETSGALTPLGREPRRPLDRLHSGGRARRTPGSPARSLNGDRCAVELGESKAAEGLVVGGPLIAQDADCDCLTE